MSLAELENRLSEIPEHFRIRVLHDAEEFVVIFKPCNLRSVPGHANPPPSRKRPRSEGGGEDEKCQRRTGQEAWVLAIQSFRDGDVSTAGSEVDQLSCQCLYRLANAEKKLIDSVPRKQKLFRRYLERNQKTLMQNGDGNDIDFDTLSNKVFHLIQARQKPLMNLPEMTKHEDSAFGQLLLMGYGGDIDNQSEKTDETASDKLFVVHRLDCETSGIMVFAKNGSAASFLSKAWRERDQVSKHYLAVVHTWPPYHDNDISQGIIEAPLSPSDERLKWKVDKDGKPSKTEWDIFRVLGEETESDTTTAKSPIILGLKPVTGRTHQLRIHCAHVGSGIEGDSLYGTKRITFEPNTGGGKLKLHAWKLIFPHPNGTEVCEFSCDPTWLESKGGEP